MNIKPLNYVCSLCFNEVEEKNVVVFKASDGRSHYICMNCALEILNQYHDILRQVNDIMNVKAGYFSVAIFLKMMDSKKEEN